AVTPETRALRRAAIGLHEALRQIGDAERLRNVIALRNVAAEMREGGEDLLGLDAFGDDGELEVVREIDERAYDLRVLRRFQHRLHEHQVDLELIERQVREVVHRRITGAEVVD